MQGKKQAAPHLLRPASDTAHSLKFTVDGAQEISALQQLDAHGTLTIDPAKLLAERHMQFARYAAYRHLSVDMFDAASSLQLGTASINLQGLLRQGREHSECLIRTPLFDALEALTVQQANAPARSGALRQNTGSATAVSRGVLQV